jgi:maleylacetoacetate isomerase
MENLTLYNYFRSSTSYRVRIALEIKKLTYKYVPVHLLNDGGEQNKESYRKINPMGGLPSLVHNGKVISQTMAILEYLDEAFPKSYPLFPKDIFEKAKVRQFCENVNTDIHPVQNLKVLKYLVKNFKITEDEKDEWSRHWITQGFTALEKMAATTAKDFCFGTKVTAADLFLIPQMVSAQRFKTDVSGFPILNQIYKNCMQMHEFKKTHPFVQIDTPDDLKVSIENLNP